MYNCFHRCITILFAILLMAPGCGSQKKISKKEREKARLAEQRPFKNKKIERLALDEAQKVYAYYKRSGQKPQTAHTIERMISLSTDHEFIEPLLHELADITFELAKYPKAEEYYAQYVLLYPGGSTIDQVRSQQIEAAYMQLSLPHRDQSKTKEIIQLSDAFLSSFPAHNTFTKRIQKIRNDCYFNLMESEINQILFYLDRYTQTQSATALSAAWQRLRHVQNEILPHLQHDKRIPPAQQHIATTLATETSLRDSTTLEQLIVPLQSILRKRFKESLPVHKHPWRNRF